MLYGMVFTVELQQKLILRALCCYLSGSSISSASIHIDRPAFIVDRCLMGTRLWGIWLWYYGMYIVQCGFVFLTNEY